MSSAQKQTMSNPIPRRQSTKKSFPKRQSSNVPTMTNAAFQSLFAGDGVKMFLGKGEDRGIAAIRSRKLLCHFSPFLKRTLPQDKNVVYFQVDFTQSNKAVLVAVLGWMVNGGDTRVKGPNRITATKIAPLDEILKLAKYLEMQPLVNEVSNQIVASFPTMECAELLKILCYAHSIGVKGLAFRTEHALGKRFSVMGVNTLLDMYSTSESLGLVSPKAEIVKLIENRPTSNFIALEHVQKAYSVSKPGAPLRIAFAKGIANRMADRRYKDPSVFITYARKNEEYFHDSEPFFDDFAARGISVPFEPRAPRVRKPRAPRARAQRLPQIGPKPATLRQPVDGICKEPNQRAKPTRVRTPKHARKLLEARKASLW